jgi:hypothetical protein
MLYLSLPLLPQSSDKADGGGTQSVGRRALKINPGILKPAGWRGTSGKTELAEYALHT